MGGLAVFGEQTVGCPLCGLTPTPTSSGTPATQTDTATPATQTETATPATQTPLSTQTETATQTSTPAPSLTPVATPTEPDRTKSPTPVSPTSTPSPTRTPRISPTPTQTPAPTQTLTATQTPIPSTATATQTLAPTQTPAPTQTLTSTTTRTPAPTQTLTATATPVARLAVAPSSVVPFQVITATGAGFGPGEPVTLYLDFTARPLTTTVATGSGGFVVRVTMPQAVVGRHTLLAVGRQTGRVASAPLQVHPLIFLRPATGAAGSASVAAGFGFAAHEPVTLRWSTPTGQLLGAATSTTVGTVFGPTAITFTVPLSPTGSYLVYGQGTLSHALAVARYTITP